MIHQRHMKESCSKLLHCPLCSIFALLTDSRTTAHKAASCRLHCRQCQQQVMVRCQLMTSEVTQYSTQSRPWLLGERVKVSGC